MGYGFTLKDRLSFYLRYFTSKVLLLLFEVKKPRFKLFFYEICYSAKKFVDRESLLPSPFKSDIVETRFGKFKIRPQTTDMANASPAFERSDMDYLLNLCRGMKKENRKILVFDVGADIGTFTVTLGNYLKDCETFRIMAFEPAQSSFAVLEENIFLNGLTGRVSAYNLALYSQDSREIDYIFNPNAPGSSGLRISGVAGTPSKKVLTRTLDSVVAEKKSGYDTFIFKIDVEGVEIEVLKGADCILHSGKDVYMIVEDFVNPEIVTYLGNIGATFLRKLTPYNSWWYYRRNG